MNVHISYRLRKTPDLEKEINHLVEKLSKRLQVFRPELLHLKGVVEQSSPRKAISVSLNLRLPSGQLAAQRSAQTALAAVKSAFDDLLQQTTRHKELLRSSHKWTRRGAARSRTEAQVPFEQTLAAIRPSTVSSEDIRCYVNANLSRLERFVERELYFLEAAEQLAPDFITKDEVIDEVIAGALGDGGDKPERLALEPWLYRLAIHAIGDLQARNTDNVLSVHLEESARVPNVRASDEPELQFHQPDETLTRESVIADRRVATPEDIASSDEMNRLMDFALASARPRDREVFVLHSIEGFSVAEIAAITDREPESIQASILAARETLRRSPPIASHFRNRRLQNTGTD
ncbi:MAG: sigma-70 family RNA polymerase sigma factor [Terriglobales bacterium]